MSTILTGIYFVTFIGVALYGLNALIMSALFLRHRQRSAEPPAATDWPAVTVQLPIFNERLVVERLIDAAAMLDYPRDRLSIQVLDDSTDETTILARACVARWQARGIDITYHWRADRAGCKAGALAQGMTVAPGQFLAIFDADFVPFPDFLRRIMPHFDNPRVGMVQARWGHLNAECDTLTRAQAIALDGHFIVEQTARSRSGLLLNFNGSAGVWRRECIASAGGWQADTIAEDFDLSYRAQLTGWQLSYLPEVVAPAEVPPLLTAFKRQQFRWAKGSIQCLRKHGARLLRSRFSPWRKAQGLMHLSGYLVHPLMLAMVLLGLPVILIRDPGNFSLSALGLAGLAPPILFALSQWAVYPDWKRRFAYFPFLVFLGAGVALNNSWAVFEALTGRNARQFLRTPKFRSEGRHAGRLNHAQDYRLPVDWTTWGEAFLALYCLVEAAIATSHAPGLAPFLAIYGIGYAYTAILGLRQSGWKSPSGRIFQGGSQNSKQAEHSVVN
jgi:cellulose synthase/poly-beta-1,6-N-acetylglucosamine synthase-like glycosyltransferase